MSAPAYGRQVLASLLVAVLIVAVVIVAVTARLGPTSVAEQEALEERQEERFDRDEELREEREERGRDR